MQRPPRAPLECTHEICAATPEVLFPNGFSFLSSPHLRRSVWLLCGLITQKAALDETAALINYVDVCKTVSSFYKRPLFLLSVRYLVTSAVEKNLWPKQQKHVLFQK
jgi:hypothetical protein